MLTMQHHLTFSHKFSFTLNLSLRSHLSSKAGSEQNLNFSNMYKEKGKFHQDHLSPGNSSNTQKNKFQFKSWNPEPLLTKPQELTRSLQQLEVIEDPEVILTELGLFSSELLHAILSNSNNQFSAVNLFTFKSTPLAKHSENVRNISFIFKGKPEAIEEIITEIQK